MKLVVDNGSKPTKPAAERTDLERRSEVQGVLVEVAKTQPLDVIVIADYGHEERSYFRTTRTREDTIKLACAGMDLMEKYLQ